MKADLVSGLKMTEPSSLIIGRHGERALDLSLLVVVESICCS